jgi:hypothetical protein
MTFIQDPSVVNPESVGQGDKGVDRIGDGYAGGRGLARTSKTINVSIIIFSSTLRYGFDNERTCR